MVALKKALTSEGTYLRTGRCPAIHHSDQGGQYAETAYVQLLQSRGVAISMAAV